MTAPDGGWDLPPEPPPGGWPKHPPGPLERAAAMGLGKGVLPPLTDEEYQRELEFQKHIFANWGSHPDPHRCVFDEGPKGIGLYFQCAEIIADPREIRYCMEHARKVGYPLTPEQLEKYTKEQTRIKLNGLSSKAVAQLEKTMDDVDAPAGVRAKAAESILDRSGFHAKADLDVHVEAVVIDMASVIKARLDAKREQLVATHPELEVLDGEVVEDPPPAS